MCLLAGDPADLVVLEVAVRAMSGIDGCRRIRPLGV